FQRRRVLSPNFVDLCGLGLIALVACSVELSVSGAGFRAFLVGLAAFCLLWALLPWLLQRLTPTRSLGRSFQTAALPSVYGSGLFLVLFSLQAVFVHQDHLLGAGLIASAGVAVAAMGFQRRQEGSLFLGSLALALAVIIAVWHYWCEDPLDNWW